MCCICVLIGDFPGIDIVLPRTGSLGARGVGPGGVGTAAPTLSNTRAYPQSPYGYMSSISSSLLAILRREPGGEGLLATWGVEVRLHVCAMSTYGTVQWRPTGEGRLSTGLEERAAQVGIVLARRQQDVEHPPKLKTFERRGREPRP